MLVSGGWKSDSIVYRGVFISGVRIEAVPGGWNRGFLGGGGE